MLVVAKSFGGFTESDKKCCKGTGQCIWLGRLSLSLLFACTKVEGKG